MSRVAYNRPISQVGFRGYKKTDPFSAAHHLSGVGDDASTLSRLDIFTPAQIQQIVSAHTSGALSDAGFNQIAEGNVSADLLADFIAADSGAPPQSNLLPELLLAGAAVWFLLQRSS